MKIRAPCLNQYFDINEIRWFNFQPKRHHPFDFYVHH